MRLDKIVLNEQLCILTAKNLGIEVPESFILNLGEGRDEEVLYATERYDRKLSSFYIGGELDIDKITRKNFEIAANDIKMNHKMVMNIFDNTVNKFEKSLREAADVLVNMGYTDAKDISEKILMMTYEVM